MSEREYIDKISLIEWLSKATGFKACCEDCTDIDCLDCIVNEVIRIFPTVNISEIKQSEWISVDDRLPDIGEKTLIVFGNNEAPYDVYAAYLDNNGEWYFFDGTPAKWYKKVAYWMPFPKPPKL